MAAAAAPSELRSRTTSQPRDDEGPGSGDDGVIQQAAAQAEDALKKGAAAVSAAAKRLHKQTLYQRVQQHIRRLRSWLWSLIEDLFEEFEPWLKWIIFDAALTLLVGQLVKHVEAVRPLFEAIGWA